MGIWLKFRDVSKYLWLGHTDDDWYRQLKKSHTKRPRLNPVEGLSVPLQAFPKQKSCDSAGSCREEEHLIYVNSCSLHPAHLQVTFEENSQAQNLRLHKLSGNLHVQRLIFISYVSWCLPDVVDPS